MICSKQEFTDDRIASLLADIIKYVASSKSKSFNDGDKCRCEINFIVRDEYLELENAGVFKVKAKTKNG
jgi:hypothetical protein